MSLAQLVPDSSASSSLARSPIHYPTASSWHHSFMPSISSYFNVLAEKGYLVGIFFSLRANNNYLIYILHSALDFLPTASESTIACYLVAHIHSGRAEPHERSISFIQTYLKKNSMDYDYIREMPKGRRIISTRHLHLNQQRLGSSRKICLKQYFRNNITRIRTETRLTTTTEIPPPDHICSQTGLRYREKFLGRKTWS
ncbi:hypothetical protein GQ43DRAFT_440743 [Delitschia confertaspora ATCC 74209]|uniref:Uncharacterized protein n=1 Tax=Delitschia confertaspora ATCC 74209 TaxID=1513339 RepID=A0A9P4JN24_9PLEO|nr:hypothetical protein GQ43DRAFT_440743 [Delitschia confertaspora ATCC 74209]